MNLYDAITAARRAGFQVYVWTDLGSGNWQIRCLCNSDKVPLQAIKITRSVEVEGPAGPARDRLLNALQPAPAVEEPPPAPPPTRRRGPKPPPATQG